MLTFFWKPLEWRIRSSFISLFIDLVKHLFNVNYVPGISCLNLGFPESRTWEKWLLWDKFLYCRVMPGGRREGKEQQSKKEGELQPAISNQVIDWWDSERPREMCPRITCPGWVRNKHLCIYLYTPWVLVLLGCHNKLPQHWNLFSHSSGA